MVFKRIFWTLLCTIGYFSFFWTFHMLWYRFRYTQADFNQLISFCSNLRNCVPAFKQINKPICFGIHYLVYINFTWERGGIGRKIFHVDHETSDRFYNYWCLKLKPVKKLKKILPWEQYGF